MSLTHAVLLLLAGLGAGLTGSIAGLASLVSYPALLATGLGPVAANVTNTVALVFSSAGSSWGSRTELRGQGARVRELGLSAVGGGCCGGALLLLTSADTLERLVPWLIAAGALVVLLQPSPVALRRLAGDRHTALMRAGTFAVGVYGGYFGAAAGVMMLALFLAGTDERLPVANALKNVVLGLANLVAAVSFALLGPVHWAAVLPLAAGCLLGGRIGPVVVRRAPTRPLRLVIAVAGLALAIHLALDAY